MPRRKADYPFEDRRIAGKCVDDTSADTDTGTDTDTDLYLRDEGTYKYVRPHPLDELLACSLLMLARVARLPFLPPVHECVAASPGTGVAGCPALFDVEHAILPFAERGLGPAHTHPYSEVTRVIDTARAFVAAWEGGLRSKVDPCAHKHARAIVDMDVREWKAWDGECIRVQ